MSKEIKKGWVRVTIVIDAPIAEVQQFAESFCEIVNEYFTEGDCKDTIEHGGLPMNLEDML